MEGNGKIAARVETKSDVVAEQVVVKYSDGSEQTVTDDFILFSIVGQDTDRFTASVEVCASSEEAYEQLVLSVTSFMEEVTE